MSCVISTRDNLRLNPLDVIIPEAKDIAEKPLPVLLYFPCNIGSIINGICDKLTIAEDKLNPIVPKNAILFAFPANCSLKPVGGLRENSALFNNSLSTIKPFSLLPPFFQSLRS